MAYKAIKNFHAIIGVCIHELYHILAAILMYPFGTRVVGWQSKIGEEVIFSVTTTTKYHLCQIFVSIAPIFFGAIAIILAIIHFNFFVYWITFAAHSECLLSDADISNARIGINALIDKQAHIATESMVFTPKPPTT